MINILKKKTSEKVGFKIKDLNSCIQLSNIILENNDEFVSYNTLRRLYKIVKDTELPSNKTLDILSRFNGYHNYQYFIKTYKFENKWKLQNDVYEIQNSNDINLLLTFLKKILKSKENHISVLIQILRELLLQKKYHQLYKIFALKELEIKNLTYDEVTHIGNGIGLLLRKINLEDEVIKTLLSIKNYQDLVFTMFVDYANLNTYYFQHIKLFKTIKSKDYLVAFYLCIENLHSYLYLKQIPHSNISLKEYYHPILKSRIIAQKLFVKYKNIINHLDKHYEIPKIPKLPIEYFYELIITAMITKNSVVMEWIIEKVEDNKEENYIFHIRHIQHYFIMKSLYFALKKERKQFKESRKFYSVEAGSTSYKEMLEIFIIIAQYQFANASERINLKNQYLQTTKKLSYPLFDENYLILSAIP
ncbi:MAG: hypothetical protein CL832_10045 [Crocinitomicaceae bacterium]|nr:hypothetical protein [Crocinitomicaceae bacterium]